MYLAANDVNRTIEATTDQGDNLPSLTVEQAKALNAAGDVQDMTIKTQRLIYDFDGDWDALANYYAECDA